VSAPVAPQSHTGGLSGPAGFTRLREARACGGATRILIIDDEHHSTAALPCTDLEGVPAGALTIEAAGPSDTPETVELRPVVHEYQVATPVPLGREDADIAPAELGARARADASVVRELIARVEELLHRTRRLPAGASSGWAGTIRFGSVLLEPATQTVLRGGQPVRVTHTEFRLLLALMRRRGAIASRIELLREVWGAGAAVSRRAVDTHIARLRRKLEDDPANPRHILTALAWGYRFRP
jgi:Transcriptional regulatory protein, C terminal